MLVESVGKIVGNCVKIFAFRKNKKRKVASVPSTGLESRVSYTMYSGEN